MRLIPRSQPVQTAFSLPEVMVASFILILVVLSSLQMTGSSILGMGRSKQRGLVDADIASHMETSEKKPSAISALRVAPILNSPNLLPSI